MGLRAGAGKPERMAHHYRASNDRERLYIELRLYSGIPQGDAAKQAGVQQPRASQLDRVYAVPTSRHPDRVPLDLPDWQPVTTRCLACGRRDQHGAQRHHAMPVPSSCCGRRTSIHEHLTNAPIFERAT